MLCVKNIEDIFEKYKNQSFDKVGSFDKNVFNTDCYLKGNGTEILECKSLNHLEYINHSNTDGIINYTNNKNTSVANLRLGLNYSRLYYYFSKIGCSEEFIKIQETNMLKYFKNSFTIKNGLYEYESNLIRQIGLYSVLNFDEKGTYNDTVQDVNYVIFISTDYFDAGIVTIKSLLLYNNINKLTIFLYGEEKDRNICKTRFERLNIKANINIIQIAKVSVFRFRLNCIYHFLIFLSLCYGLSKFLFHGIYKDIYYHNPTYQNNNRLLLLQCDLQFLTRKYRFYAFLQNSQQLVVLNL